VPKRVVDAMQAARSKGRYFNKYIRDKFATTEME